MTSRVSEAAARGAGHRRPPSDAPEMVFLVPLIGRAYATDWEAVCRRLRATLESLLGQSDPAWRAFICCQDRPERMPEDDRICHLPFVEPEGLTLVSGKPFDKGAKIAAMVDHLEETCRGDGYLFLLDADDLLHPGLVAHVLGDNNGRGYFVEQGYMMDLESGRLGFLGRRSLRYPRAHPFYRHCGSSSAMRFDLRNGAEGLDPVRARGKHKEIPENMRKHGLPMDAIPFPAAVYLLGHGGNMRLRRGMLEGQIGYLKRNLVPRRKEAAIYEAFRLNELAPR